MSSRPAATASQELVELARLAIPIAAAQAGQAAMALVDVAVVGHVGAVPLGAVGLANSIFFAVAILGMGTMMGLDPLASQALGAGDGIRARRLLWQGGWLALLASAVLGLMLCATPLGLRLFHIDGETAALTTRCVWIRIPSMAPFMVFIVARAYLQARGKTMPMVVSTVLANVFNLLSDLVLVFGGARFGIPGLRWIPAMGAEGAVLSTTLGSFLQAAVVLVAIWQLDRSPLPHGARKPVLGDILAATKVGLPIGLQMGAEVGVFSLVTVLAAKLGSASLAAHQLALTMASFTFSVALGVGNAGSVRVGWAVGQRDTPGARRAGLVAFAAGAGVMLVSAASFVLFPGALVHLFTDQADVFAVAVPLLGVAAVFQISDGIQAVGAGVLRGAGDTVFAFGANLVGHYLVGLPVAIALGFWAAHSIVGLWWGLCCGLTVVALALISRFLWLSARPIVPLERQPGPAH